MGEKRKVAVDTQRLIEAFSKDAEGKPNGVVVDASLTLIYVSALRDKNPEVVRALAGYVKGFAQALCSLADELDNEPKVMQ